MGGRLRRGLRVPACRRHYPGGPLGPDRSWDGLFHPFPLSSQRRRPSPCECKVGDHIGRFEACSAFTRVAACRLAESPCDPFVSKAPTVLSPPPPPRYLLAG